MSSKFVDTKDNKEKSIDRAMLITSGRINVGARQFLVNKFSNRSLIIIDGKKLTKRMSNMISLKEMHRL